MRRWVQDQARHRQVRRQQQRHEGESHQLEYELENERAHARAGGKLRAVEASLPRSRQSGPVQRACKEQEKEIFKLEKKNEETQRGFDTGMAVAKKQIKYLEELLEEGKRKNQDSG